MSFRELRNFTEIMRNLGYPGLISMENFRTPNFVLVADVLYWLLQRYDPDSEIDDSISTESERIQFLKTVAQKIFYKARIKLNIKKLYAADGYAVKELLKLASLLHKATAIAEQDQLDDNMDDAVKSNSSKFQDNVRTLRNLSSDLTELGAALHNSLVQEIDLRRERSHVIEQPVYNPQEVRQILEDKLAETQETVNQVVEQTQALEQDEENLEQKKKRKLADLERYKKSLTRLQTFKPAFMEEYERKEKELQHLYTEYVEHWRNLEFLEHELEKYRRAEEEQMEENNKRLANMRKKLKDEELMILRGEKIMEQDLDDEDIEAYLSNQEMRSSQQNSRSMNRPRAASGRRPMSSSGKAQQEQIQQQQQQIRMQQQRQQVQQQSQKQAVVRGSMFGDEDDEEDEDDDDDEDEDDDGADEESEEEDDDEEEDEGEEDEDEGDQDEDDEQMF